MQNVKGDTKGSIPNLVLSCLVFVTVSLIQLSAPVKGFAFIDCTWCTSEFNECSTDAYDKYAWGIWACGDGDDGAQDECREEVDWDYAVDMWVCNDDFSWCWSECSY